jgi:hypothetical protein
VVVAAPFDEKIEDLNLNEMGGIIPHNTRFYPAEILGNNMAILVYCCEPLT